MTDGNGFTYRYAIRRPDGGFVLQPRSSDLAFLRGMLGGVADDDVAPRMPRTWDSREAADQALDGIRKQAAELGVFNWLGVAVQQLCTPFTLHDPAEHFADEIQQWLAGGAK